MLEHNSICNETVLTWQAVHDSNRDERLSALVRSPLSGIKARRTRRRRLRRFYTAENGEEMHQFGIIAATVIGHRKF